MSTALADNYIHLLIIRFFLGVTESPYFPGALFLLSAWYPKKVGQATPNEAEARTDRIQ